MIKGMRLFIGTWIAFGHVMVAAPPPPQWVLKADYVDACCCDLACPCLFGGSPTKGFCKGTLLMEIKEGRYG